MAKFTSSSTKYISIYFGVTAVEGLFALFYLASITADPKNSVLWGFSISRLILMGVFAAVIVLFAWLAIKAGQGDRRIQQLIEKGFKHPVWSAALIFTGSTFFIIAWLSIFLPDYRFGGYSPFHDRLQPFILWMGLAGIQLVVLVFLLNQQIGLASIKDFAGRNRKLLITCACFFTLLIAILLIILASGVAAKEDFINFNLPGVPLLTIQVLLVWLILAGIYFISRIWKNFHPEPLPLISGKNSSSIFDVLITLLIWAGTLIIWKNTSFPGSFFAPGPYAPDQQFYPFSDAAGYDLTAQFALIGQGLNNLSYVDKPLYSVFLLWLNLIGGGQVNRIITMQIAVLALYPVLIYWLGTRLHSRLAGLAAALFVIINETNAISSSRRLLNTNSHLFMTEVPTAMMLVIFTYLFFRWAQKPEGRRIYLIASAGVLGLTTLLRHNTWFILPFIVLLIVLISGWDWRKWVLRVGIFVLFIIPAILPWMVYSGKTEYTPFYFIIPFRGSVIPDRYFEFVPTRTPQPKEENLQAITTLPPTSTLEPKITPTPTPRPNNPHDSDMKSLRNLRYLIDFFPAQLSNNLKTAILLLPLDWKYHDIEHTITKEGSFWSGEWNGAFNREEFTLLILNLALLSIGLGYTWWRWGWAGLVPLFVFTGYILSNVIARSSGGRYIIPVEWVVFLYFGVGLVEGGRWITDILHLGNSPSIDDLQTSMESPGKENNPSSEYLKAILIGLLFLGIGTFITLSGSFFPQRYQSVTKQEMLESKGIQEFLTQIPVQPEVMDKFLAQDQAVILNGRLIYPRYYVKDQGEPDRFTYYSIRTYPRMVFTLIGQNGRTGVILPDLEIHKDLSNYADVVVIGCQTEDTVQAVAVQIQGQEPKTILRSPFTALSCPLVEPVCDDNRNCK